jgi:hypothetical protein
MASRFMFYIPVTVVNTRRDRQRIKFVMVNKLENKGNENQGPNHLLFEYHKAGADDKGRQKGSAKKR